jgi:hypothetical protein
MIKIFFVTALQAKPIPTLMTEAQAQEFFYSFSQPEQLLQFIEFAARMSQCPDRTDFTT